MELPMTRKILPGDDFSTMYGYDTFHAGAKQQRTIVGIAHRVPSAVAKSPRNYMQHD